MALENGITEGIEGTNPKKVVVVHHCTQEATLGEMMGLLKRMVHEIYGNGQQGIAFTVPALSVKIDNLAEQVSLLNTTVSAIAKFQAERTGDIRTEDKIKLSSRQWTAIIIAGTISITGVVISLLHLLKV